MLLAFVAAVAFVLVRADQFLGDGAVHMKTMLPYVRVWNEEEGEKNVYTYRTVTLASVIRCILTHYMHTFCAP